jgi:hypothetical protein
MLASIESCVSPTRITSDFAFPYTRIKDQPSFVGPRATLNLNSLTVNDTDIAEAQAGKAFIYIWGDVTYFDIFDSSNKHVIQFCVSLDGVIGDPLRPDVANNVDFNFTFQDFHNSAN